MASIIQYVTLFSSFSIILTNAHPETIVRFKQKHNSQNMQTRQAFASHLQASTFFLFLENIPVLSLKCCFTLDALITSSDVSSEVPLHFTFTHLADAFFNATYSAFNLHISVSGCVQNSNLFVLQLICFIVALQGLLPYKPQ